LRAEPRHRSRLDLDALPLEVGDRLGDRARPDEAEVAIPGADGQAGDVVRKVDPGTVNVQLRVAQPVGDAAGAGGDELGPEDVAIEPVRDLPIRDRDDAVVEPDPQRLRPLP
jgi:hypothetical protein